MIKNVFLTILLFLCFENCISQNTNNNQDSVFKQNLDLGHYYIRNGKIDSLKIQLLKLDSLFLLSKKDSTKLYELKVLKSSFAIKDDRVGFALVELLKAQLFFENQKDTVNYAYVLTKLAVANYYLNRRDISLQYFDKALELKAFLPKKTMYISLQNIGAINLELAIGKQEDSLFKKAIKSFNTLRIIYSKEKWFDELALVNSLLAECYIQLEDRETALLLLDDAITLTKKTNNKSQEGFALIKKTTVYGLNKEYEKGLKTIREAKKILKNIEGKHTYIYVMVEEKKILIGLKRFEEAAELGEEIYQTSVQVYDTDFIDKVAEMDAKYKVAVKEKMILEQQQKLLKNKLEKKNKNLYIVLLLFGIIILGLLYYFYYKKSKLRREQLRKELELKDALSQIKTQNQLQAQRLRISRDLHDNIGSQLTFIISSIENLKFAPKITTEKFKERLTTISSFTSSTISQLRDTIWAMNKNKINFEDFNGRIMSFIEKAKISCDNIEFTYETIKQSNIEFTSINGVNLFRVVQESINNAIKYSGGNEINVKLKKEENTLIISIEDNGIGFEKDKITFGNGLENMKKRIKEVGGELEINSILEKGTYIKIKYYNTTKSVL